MGMTMSQKILAAHAGKDQVAAGELLSCSLDLVLSNDITASPAIDEFNKLGIDTVWDRTKIALVADHFVPNKDIKAAAQAKKMEEFAIHHKIVNYFGVCGGGIEHILLPEKGLVAPGDLIIGADSHTCTYGAFGSFSTGVGSTDAGMAYATGKVWLKVPEAIKINLKGHFKRWVSGKDLILYLIGKIGVDGALYKSLEFCGPGVSALNMADRSTIANMAIEAGAKNGIFPVDSITKEYLRQRVSKRYTVYEADQDAEYCAEYDIDLSQIPLLVACPHLPSNVREVGQVSSVALNQVVIGSCTNGKIEDLRLAAQVMKGHKVAKNVRCLIMPGSHEVYKQALQEDLLSVFAEANAMITMPTCGPCLGGHCGVLAEGEVALATTNRNFVGRMGHPKSQVYLSGPTVAAASAIKGRISNPNSI
ncbi:MAG: 3-isopropylmalate dehydratase large subunit [Bacillota bacterium]|jgi:3-isopropylmalate/(R)-2-methylmalate dehydratase large subunit